jgi:integrase/recombinase XerD
VQLFDGQGKRLYFTDDERKAFLGAARKAPREVRSFCSTLHYTGCRISEALALTPKSIDLSGKVIVFESLKKCRRGVYRPMPVPPELLDTLDVVPSVRELQRKGGARLNEPLWPWSRMTAWRRIQQVIDTAGIGEGPHACPKGVEARLWRSGGQQGHCAQHGAEMVGSFAAYHDGDLCKCSRGGRAEYRR